MQCRLLISLFSDYVKTNSYIRVEEKNYAKKSAFCNYCTGSIAKLFPKTIGLHTSSMISLSSVTTNLQFY